MKRPSPASLLLALVPCFGLCFLVPLWDRVSPTVFGLPFNLFWLVSWLLVTPLIMLLMYRIENRR
ncbi:MAG TPA: DUF3311 domain-containing protein [Opitutaceae bacterium]|jgi:hypothetical protein